MQPFFWPKYDHCLSGWVEKGIMDISHELIKVGGKIAAKW